MYSRLTCFIQARDSFIYFHYDLRIRADLMTQTTPEKDHASTQP